MYAKPQLAEDAILDKLIFPVWEQPKIDGVRALNRNGKLTGRSLEEFQGHMVTDFFSRPGFVGLDGEMTLGSKPTGERLCSLTTGALGRFKDVTEMADFHWWVFDYLTEATIKEDYWFRYAALEARVKWLEHPRVHLVPTTPIYSMEQLAARIQANYNAGYEGTILRNPNAPFKEGRATQDLQHLWRIKPWADAEILVTSISEGAKNTNEAKKNKLGRTERSSSLEGMVPNGMVGSIHGVMLADFHCPFTKKLLFAKDLPVTIGPGKMTDKEAKFYFENQSYIVGHVVKFKHLATGVKDAPRMATYLSHRLKQDMSS